MSLRTKKWSLLVIAAVGAFCVFNCTGRGGLGYFSPHTFQMRSQSELLFAPLGPLIEVPLYRSAYRYREEPYELVTYLVEHGYWAPVDMDQPTWIPMFHWNNMWRDGETQFYRYMTRDYERWIEWTEANPGIANVMWPKVLEIFREGRMNGSAEAVMQIAQFSSSVDEFRFRVNHDPELQSFGISMP